MNYITLWFSESYAKKPTCPVNFPWSHKDFNGKIAIAYEVCCNTVYLSDLYVYHIIPQSYDSTINSPSLICVDLPTL